jgi:hypothetical protein
VWIALGFLCLGLLIGTLVGLTATSVVVSVLGLLFAFAGGSVLAFLHKIGAADRVAAGQALMTFSLACLVGLYAAIYVSEHRILSPAAPVGGNTSQTTRGVSDKVASSATKQIESAGRKYLLSDAMTEAQGIDLLLSGGKISADEAYRRLSKIVQNSTCVGE